MRAENSIPNKIIPIKSLVQSTKHNTKKHSIQFTTPEPTSFPIDQICNTKTPQSPYSHIPTHIYSQGHSQQQHNQQKDKIKGISVGSKNYSLIKISQETQKNDTPHKIYKPFQEYSYVHKVPTHGHSRHQSDITKNVQFFAENTKKQKSVNKTPKMETLPFQEKHNFRGLGSDKMDFFKSVTINKPSQEQDSPLFYERSSTKLQDQTWNASKFQKTMTIERDSQPIFKDQLTKIKTQLFQKEAVLFQTTQKLEERQRNIKQLRCKLEVEMQLNRTLKNKLTNHKIINQQGSTSQNKSFNIQIERLNDEISRLKNELSKSKDQKNKEDLETATSSKLLQLKLKQFQLEQKERTHYILQLKDKQKRAAENYEKMLNGQRELLRQKEQQLTQISQAAHFYKDQYSKIEKMMEELKQRLKFEAESKEFVIRQLSGQVGDLKCSLRNMEIRMRELIENEDELKKEIDNYNTSKAADIKQSNDMALIKSQLLMKDAQIQELKSEKQLNLAKIAEFETKLNSKVCEFENNASLKEMQVSMMSKTCQQYKRKLDQYHKYSQQMRKSLQNYNHIEMQLKKVLIQKEQEIYLLKVSYDSPNKSKSSQKAISSPVKEGRMEDKEYNRLKNINVKLIKENEKLNMIVKDLDFKIYQLYKVNESLNEIILVQLFKGINQNLRQKYGDLPGQLENF